MGPKKDAKKKVETADFVGAKICNISVGEPNDMVVVKINLNCTLDISLAYARRSILAGLDSKIKEINDRLQEPPMTARTSARSPRSPRAEVSPEGAAAGNSEIDKENVDIVISQLNDFKRVLANGDISKLELFDDAGAVVGVQQVRVALLFVFLRPSKVFL